jgi:hypothetical protein
MVRVFEKIIEPIKNKIKIVQSDNGSEFIYTKLLKYLYENNIKVINSTPYTPKTNGCIERFNRTLKSIIFKTISNNESKHFVNYLEDIIHNYNNSYHSTIKNTPNNIINGSIMDIENAKLNTIIKNYPEIPNIVDIKRGDYVRIRLDIFPEYKKKIFNKKYVPNYTKEIYKVVNISRGNQPMYRIEDENSNKLQKSFYNDDLLLINKQKLIKNVK